MQRWRRRASAHRDGGARLALVAGVIDPVDGDLAAGLGPGEEFEIGVGGDAAGQFHAEHFDAVVAAGDIVNHVLGIGLAGGIEAKTGFHRVLDDKANGDQFAALGGGGDGETKIAHAADMSRQAEEVTSTGALAEAKLPSLKAATATRVWVPPRRTRVTTSGLPLALPKKTLATLGRGLRGAKTCRLMTLPVAASGTDTRKATAWPFSTSRGISIFTRPGTIGLPPDSVFSRGVISASKRAFCACAGSILAIARTAVPCRNIRRGSGWSLMGGMVLSFGFNSLGWPSRWQDRPRHLQPAARSVPADRDTPRRRAAARGCDETPASPPADSPR